MTTAFQTALSRLSKALCFIVNYQSTWHSSALPDGARVLDQTDLVSFIVGVLCSSAVKSGSLACSNGLLHSPGRA